MIWVNILPASNLMADKVHRSLLDVLQKVDGVLFLAAVVDSQFVLKQTCYYLSLVHVLQLCTVSQLYSSSETFALLLRVATSHVGGPFTYCAKLMHFE